MATLAATLTFMLASRVEWSGGLGGGRIVRVCETLSLVTDHDPSDSTSNEESEFSGGHDG